MIAKTPDAPYFAVIFTNEKSENLEGYPDMADHMVRLAEQQPGFLGFESAGESFSITVSYWKDMESIANWKANLEHRAAQDKGRQQWYKAFRTRVCEVKIDRGLNQRED